MINLIRQSIRIAATLLLAKHAAGQFEYTKGIAAIYYFDGPDCPNTGNMAKYDVPPLTGPGAGFPSPDQCDPGLPPINNYNDVSVRESPPASFIVDATANTCAGDDKYELAAVILYPQCVPKPNQSPDEPFNKYCEDICATEAWSISDGYSVCVNTPQIASSGGPYANRIEQTIRFCS